ncbi:T9SS type A sorting domain-containing protein [Flavobacterium sp. J49]|uniref:T9SS type A sorting domain-containing protein n=1 Tax=Flavobacterium sp. J49 TaxID=2718534 RepID=UPI001592B0E6|nr:T9SS type A sorting domain-containing protein [Flavobacterium sp. J49]MBF6642187.1 T9SS type A sorting domain-containing protein [Flavobacterium sp. J49]NIC03434.1 T9SS type A sorting domain-containing protein [Flavobacterium sp. J49]
MKKNYLLPILLLCQLGLHAQTFGWLRTPSITFNMNPGMISYPTASDHLGNTYLCGFKDNATPYTDIFGNLALLKYDTNGTLVATKNINGNVHAYKLATDNAGNLYMAVGYLTSITIDNFSLTTNLQSVNPLLLKFNANGELLWHKVIPGEWTQHFNAISIDSQQNVYIGYDDYQNSFIEKLDANGNTLQLITQTEVKLISAVSVDSEGNIYAAGSCAEISANFNGTNMPAPFLYNIYLVKYNPAGQMQWMHYVEDITCPEPMVVARTPDEVYFSSHLFDGFSIDGITTEGPVNNYDFFLAKFNSTGTVQWVKEVPGTGGAEIGLRNFLTLDPQGNIYMAGKTQGAIQWNANISSQPQMGFNSDVLILKYSPQGTVLWAKTAGGNSEDRSDGISVLPDGSVVVSGMANNIVTFDTWQAGTVNFQYYPFLAKLNQTTLSIPANEFRTALVYPNPVQDFVTLSSPGYRGKAELFTLLGQKLKSFDITADETQLSVSDIAIGTYLLRLNQQAIKIVKD